MIIILSPAKTLDFETKVGIRNDSQPQFKKQANKLAGELAKLSPKQLSKMMNISTRLADLTYERFQNWKNKPDEELSRQAIFAFKGDVYQGLQIGDFNKRDIEYAQEHLRILSGLYGLLKPLDRIQPHRLEMGTVLQNKHTLYEFWSKKVTTSLKKDLSATDNRLINLASQEYFRVLNLEELKADIITPVFKDNKSGTYKIISIYAKKARGKMASFIVRNRIKDPEQIKAFEEDGYNFNSRMSSTGEFVFTRG